MSTNLTASDSAHRCRHTHKVVGVTATTTQRALSVTRAGAGEVHRDDMVWVPRGTFTMGSMRYYPEERPCHRVHVDGFWIDRGPVTNDAFAAFVRETGYVTVAERPLRLEDYPGVAPELLVSGSAVFRQPAERVHTGDARDWWSYVAGASWRCPEGPHSSIEGRGGHPVVHVAFEDALAFAAWAGKSLPSEAQWERACRGTLENREFAWGDELWPGGRTPANVWVGRFPWDNRKPHRPGTTPVGSYPTNDFGLSDMIGNVWEWTTDYYRSAHAVAGASGSSCCVPRNPRGPSTPLAEPDAPGIPLRVLKGGSFLCAPNYCARYRPAARIPQASDSAACHIGFRCVVVPDEPAHVPVSPHRVCGRTGGVA